MMWQVSAVINQTAVTGVIQGAMESAGTPNRLVQVDLELVPTVNIQPQSLSPAVLFEGSFAVSTSQTVTLTNQGNTSVTFNVSCALQPPAGDESAVHRAAVHWHFKRIAMLKSACIVSTSQKDYPSPKSPLAPLARKALTQHGDCHTELGRVRPEASGPKNPLPYKPHMQRSPRLQITLMWVLMHAASTCLDITAFQRMNVALMSSGKGHTPSSPANGDHKSGCLQPSADIHIRMCMAYCWCRTLSRASPLTSFKHVHRHYLG